LISLGEKLPNIILLISSHNASFKLCFLAYLTIILAELAPSYVMFLLGFLPRAIRFPRELLRDLLEEHVRKISPKPAGVAKSVDALIFLHNNFISAIPFTRRADLVLTPKPSPSTIPQPIARIFLMIPQISAVLGSSKY